MEDEALDEAGVIYINSEFSEVHYLKSLQHDLGIYLNQVNKNQVNKGDK